MQDYSGCSPAVRTISAVAATSLPIACANCAGDEATSSNPRAVTFYRRHGFREIGRLLGWRRPTTSDALQSGAPPEETSILHALQTPCARDYPEVPWQISRHAIAKVEKTRAFRATNACVVIGDPEAPAIRVHGLFSSEPGWQDLRAALAKVLALFPEREFFAPAIWPEEFGAEVFEPLGFRREPLTQFLMRLDL